jgi:HTH-type transcriptional regulator/antitoxin HigA
MTRIENEVQYQWAVAKVEKLLPLVNDHTLPDDPSYIELALLSNLVADYSDGHFALGSPTLVDSIRLRMYEMGLTQKALSDLLGISPKRINEIITGRKEPTYHIARDISKKLDIDASIVLGVSS